MNIEHLLENKKVLFSMEVFPPKKTDSIETVYKSIYGLRSLTPDFISVTYGAGGSTTQRSKTVEIASLIKREYGIESVSHLTCIGATKEEIRKRLDDLKANNITNVLALRGDKEPEGACGKDFKHASDLVAFVHEEEPDFHIIGACYPEKHNEADTLEADIRSLRYKIDAGVSHLITQLFFDNEKFCGTICKNKYIDNKNKFINDNTNYKEKENDEHENEDKNFEAEYEGDNYDPMNDF